jgi:hypothetical protein
VGPRWPWSVEEFEDEFEGSGDDGPVSEDCNGALHQLGVGEEQVDDAVGVERAGVRAEFLVGPDEVGGFTGQHGEKAIQRFPVEGFLEVLDDVELDAALLEDAEGATGLASTGVVVEQQSIRHGDDPRNRPSIGSKRPRRCRSILDGVSGRIVRKVSPDERERFTATFSRCGCGN